MPRQGHNTPLPLERSPPVSFKRLLGSGLRHCAAFLVLIGHRKIPNFDRPQVLVMDDGSQVHVAMWAPTVANL